MVNVADPPESDESARPEIHAEEVDLLATAEVPTRKRRRRANGSGTPVRLADPEGEDAWRARLIYTTIPLPDGKFAQRIKRCTSNILTLGAYHPDLAGLFATNDFSGQIELTRAPPWTREAGAETTAREWRESDVTRLVDWLERNELLTVGNQQTGQALSVLAERQHVHPVRVYLDGLRWDGKQRLPSWLSDYCGVAPSEYASQVGRRWMISAVARAMQPGCQADCVLILQGREQGRGKSNAFRALAPNANWYTETSTAIGSKDGYQALGGRWIVLLDELDAVRKGEITKVKTFLTALRDTYRPPYARLMAQFPRQCVFGGTTNEDAPLVDRTGNRRFWVVAVGERVDFAAIARDRNQLWAEAKACYDSSVPWWVDSDELRKLCEAEQSERVAPDDWEVVIERWLALQVVNGDEYGILANGVSTLLMLDRAIGMQKDDITRADTMRVAECLRSLGYIEAGRPRGSGGKRERIYRPGPTCPTSDRDLAQTDVARARDAAKVGE